MGLNETIHVEAHGWHVIYSVLINNDSQTFSHYYDLNLIYIKAPLQMTSKDALASLNSIILNSQQRLFLVDQHTLWLVFEMWL